MIGSAPEFSVTDFVEVFNQSLEAIYPEVVILGEISNIRISKQKWVYFDLKDELSSVKFFGTIYALPGPLEDGMTVKVVGRPFLHAKFGFSIQMKAVQVTGEGALGKAFELLKANLEKEGLFDYQRKRSLPAYPQKIALIASTESAGYEDFIKIVLGRWPKLEIEKFDVNVQGTEAPEMIVEAINKANQSDFDAIVLIRGGGSRDDLVSFDHEQVVRAVAASKSPTLVAIGHERDVVLAELAADLRASTPSNAAEVLVPDRKQELEFIARLWTEIDVSLSEFSKKISDQILEYKQEIADRMESLISENLDFIASSRKLIDAYDPLRPLRSGYALAKDHNGQVIRTKDRAVKLVNFDLEFIDGRISAKVIGKDNG